MRLEDFAKLVNGRDFDYDVEKPKLVKYGNVLVFEDEANILRELERLCGEFSFEVENSFVTQIDLSDKELSYLPDYIKELTNLEDLNLSWNKLTELPESVKELTNLRKLNLDYNKLEKLPESIG